MLRNILWQLASHRPCSVPSGPQGGLEGCCQIILLSKSFKIAVIWFGWFANLAGSDASHLAKLAAKWVQHIFNCLAHLLRRFTATIFFIAWICCLIALVGCFAAWQSINSSRNYLFASRTNWREGMAKPCDIAVWFAAKLLTARARAKLLRGCGGFSRLFRGRRPLPA